MEDSPCRVQSLCRWAVLPLVWSLLPRPSLSGNPWGSSHSILPHNIPNFDWSQKFVLPLTISLTQFYWLFCPLRLFNCNRIFQYKIFRSKYCHACCTQLPQSLHPAEPHLSSTDPCSPCSSPHPWSPAACTRLSGGFNKSLQNAKKIWRIQQIIAKCKTIGVILVDERLTLIPMLKRSVEACSYTWG